MATRLGIPSFLRNWIWRLCLAWLGRASYLKGSELEDVAREGIHDKERGFKYPAIRERPIDYQQLLILRRQLVNLSTTLDHQISRVPGPSNHRCHSRRQIAAAQAASSRLLSTNKMTVWWRGHDERFANGLGVGFDGTRKTVTCSWAQDIVRHSGEREWLRLTSSHMTTTQTHRPRQHGMTSKGQESEV